MIANYEEVNLPKMYTEEKEVNRKTSSRKEMRHKRAAMLERMVVMK